MQRVEGEQNRKAEGTANVAERTVVVGSDMQYMPVVVLAVVAGNVVGVF